MLAIVRGFKMTEVPELVQKSRKAQREYENNGSQQRYDRAAKAVAWAVLQPENNKILASLAVECTGMGNVKDKITKNHRKTLGLMRDLESVKSYGIINHMPQQGLIEIARPKGVIASIVPSTNPAATPANNIINALKMSKKIGLKSYAILGFSGGKAKSLANIPMHFEINDMQIAEDTQIIIGHLLMKLLNKK